MWGNEGIAPLTHTQTFLTMTLDRRDHQLHTQVPLLPGEKPSEAMTQVDWWTSKLVLVWRRRENCLLEIKVRTSQSTRSQPMIMTELECSISRAQVRSDTEMAY